MKEYTITPGLTGTWHTSIWPLHRQCVQTNNFDVELQELIDRWRDAIGIALEELRDALQDAADKLAEEIDAKML